jgi:hypothetical protein
VRVVELELETLAHTGHRQRLAHLGPGRLHLLHGGACLGVAGTARRQLGHDGGALERTGLHDEALIYLGEEDVVAAADLRPGPHRGTEARARGCGALDGDDERGGSAGTVVLVRELAPQEDPVLRLEGRDLAGSDSQEGQRRRIRHGLLEAEAAAAMSRGDRQVGRERKPLPGRRAHVVAEDALIALVLQAIASGRLFVVPAGRQSRCRLDLVVDDRAVSDRGADDSSARFAKAIDQGAEIRAGKEPLLGRGRLARDRGSDQGRSDLQGTELVKRDS